MTFIHIVNLKSQSRILPWAHLGWPGSVPEHFNDFSCGWPGLRLKVWPWLGPGVGFSFALPVKSQQRLQLANIYLGALHWGQPGDSEHEMKHRCRSQQELGLCLMNQARLWWTLGEQSGVSLSLWTCKIEITQDWEVLKILGWEILFKT